MSASAGRALPTGVVTFLFTDIEGSTRLWERAADEMRRALARHDELMHEVVEGHAGIVFKTVGDSFCCVFENSDQALGAAVAAQHALLDEQWPRSIGQLRVRAGLHTGAAVLRRRDYFGPTVNRVARLTAAAHGNQILLSSATATLLTGKLGDIQLRDLGTHRLRDLGEPERIFQAIAPGLPVESLPPASLDSTPNNLPSQISSFVGRLTDLKRLRQLMHQHPLITITGLGGIGKTRLALQLAAKLVAEFKDGCWFVSLKEIDDPAQIVQATADAMHVRTVPGEPLEETLFDHLFKKKVLIVLDNAEHLLIGAAKFVRRLLNCTSQLSIIVTSREPLHVTGEQVLRIGPMEEAVNLFIDRARALGTDFEVSEASSAAIANICAKLQGIPLAIELAAARVASIPVTKLDELLSSQLHLLSSDPTQPANSLNAMLNWSFRLLKPSERRFFTRLAIFDGSFALEAAEAVAWEDGLRGDALVLLGSLRDKSLVSYATEAGLSRYYLLDVVREFARERLRESPEAPLMGQRHSSYYFGLLHALTSQRVTKDFGIARLTAEWNNIRAALRFALEEKADVEGGRWAVRNLSDFWVATGRTTEGWYWINQALEGIHVPAEMRAELLERAAQVASSQRNYSALVPLAKLLVEIRERSGDAAGLAKALRLLANGKLGLGNGAEAELYHRKALDQFRMVGDRRGIAATLAGLAFIAEQHHLNDDAARQLYRHSLETYRELGFPHVCADLLGNLSVVNARAGDFAEAIDCARQSLTIFQKLGNESSAGNQHLNMAETYIEWGKLNDALAELRAARRALGDEPQRFYLAYYFEAAFKLAMALAESETAALIYGFAELYRSVSGSPLHPREQKALESRRDTLVAALGSVSYERLRVEGATMDATAVEGLIEQLGSAPKRSSASG
jgi:predicted ATPase/class 3 adenylate cyclase